MAGRGVFNVVKEVGSKTITKRGRHSCRLRKARDAGSHARRLSPHSLTSHSSTIMLLKPFAKYS